MDLTAAPPTSNTAAAAGHAADPIGCDEHHLDPHDLEEAVEALPGVRRGCVAVLGAPDAHRDGVGDGDGVVVVAETCVTALEFRATLRERIEELALEMLGVPADEVVLAPPHTVPRTASGKIRHAACRALYRQRRPAQGSADAGLIKRLWHWASIHRRS